MIPIIIGAAALGSAAIGALAGAAGKADMDLAREIGDRAQKRHKRAVTDFQAKFEATNMVGGFHLAGKGEKALTEARKYQAKVETEISKIEAAQEFLQQVEQRIRELGQLAHKLEQQAELMLNALESKPFNRSQDTGKLQQVALLVKALAEITKTPILNSEGKLNYGIVTILEKYRNL